MRRKGYETVKLLEEIAKKVKRKDGEDNHNMAINVKRKKKMKAVKRR